MKSSLILALLLLAPPSASSQNTGPCGPDRAEVERMLWEEVFAAGLFHIGLLVDRAEIIVSGTVVDTAAYVSDNGAGTIRTDVTVRIHEHLRGAEGQDNITFVVLGGKVGTSSLSVTNTARFSEGEEVLVFLYHFGPFGSLYPAGTLTTVGGDLGKRLNSEGLEDIRDYLANCVSTSIRPSSWAHLKTR